MEGLVLAVSQNSSQAASRQRLTSSKETMIWVGEVGGWVGGWVGEEDSSARRLPSRQRLTSSEGDDDL